VVLLVLDSVGFRALKDSRSVGMFLRSVSLYLVSIGEGLSRLTVPASKMRFQRAMLIQTALPMRRLLLALQKRNRLVSPRQRVWQPAPAFAGRKVYRLSFPLRVMQSLLRCFRGISALYSRKESALA